MSIQTRQRANALTTETIESLRTSLRGRLIAPGEEGYDDARTIWNGMIDKRPGLVVQPAGVADVIAAVTFARENDLLLAIKGGGHNVAGNALCDHDPLQACVEITMANSVTDRWLVRRLPGLVRAAGCEIGSVRSHGFAETTAGGYMQTIIERGADMLRAFGQIGPETATMLKAEAQRRVAAGDFFGHIAYGSVTARKPLA